ncbi:MAG: hypothetical protein HW402_383 [Dehalococcoidales bacterium]|nr:hypothetical protein [Dehalococcoidales bacterium]
MMINPGCCGDSRDHNPTYELTCDALDMITGEALISSVIQLSFWNIVDTAPAQLLIKVVAAPCHLQEVCGIRRDYASIIANG